jgi:hypothetical protein
MHINNGILSGMYRRRQGIVSLLQPKQAWSREQKDGAENAMKKYCKKMASLLLSLAFFLYLRKYK